MKLHIWILLIGLAVVGCKANQSSTHVSSVMKYQSGQVVFLGDRVTYSRHKGCIALIGCESRSGCPGIQRSEWTMNDTEVLILFDDGGRLILEKISEEDLLVFCGRAGGSDLH